MKSKRRLRQQRKSSRRALFEQLETRNMLTGGVSEYTVDDIRQLDTFRKTGIDGLDAFYAKMESKGDRFAAQARGVINGSTPEGAFALQFLHNEAVNSGVFPDGLTQSQWDTIKVSIMNKTYDDIARQFETGNTHPELTYYENRDNHSEVFNAIGLSSNAWTLFTPIEFGVYDKQTSYESIIGKSVANAFGYDISLSRFGSAAYLFIDNTKMHQRLLDRIIKHGIKTPL